MHHLMGRVKKNQNLKIKNNFTKDERKALKKLQRNVKLRVHEFDESCERVTNKIQKSCKLRKETKTNEVYLELYSYELIPPRLY